MKKKWGAILLSAVMMLSGIPVYAATGEDAALYHIPEAISSNAVSAGEKQPEVPVSGIKVAKGSLSVVEKMRDFVSASVVPKDATNQKIRYFSSNTEVAEVGKMTGVIKAKQAGQCVITAKSDDGGFEEKVTVTVDKWIPVESVSLKQKEYAMTVGDRSFADAVAAPKNATNSRIRYISSDPSVASVSSASGLLKAVSAGECEIKAVSVDGGKEDVCRVTVKDPYVKVEQVEILSIPDKIYVGDKAVLGVHILPENATRKDVSWNSSDEQVLKVSENGTIEAAGVGIAVIQAVSIDGAEGRQSIEVLPVPVQDILIEKDEIKVESGELFGVGYQIVPDNATNQAVFAESKNSDIVDVLPREEGGAIGFLAKAPGTTEIIYQTEDGGKTAVCKVEVTKKEKVLIEDILLKQNLYEIREGESTAVLYRVLPVDSDEAVYFRSSDPEIVSVTSGAGLLRGLKPGEATIFIESKSKTVKRECQVIVKAKDTVQSIVLNESEIHLAESERAQLTASLVPKTSTEYAIFTSSDSSVAAVGARTGSVKACSVGECVITASVPGGPSAQCKIIVTPMVPVEKIVPAREKMSVSVGSVDFIAADISPVNATIKTLYYKSSDETVVSISKGTGLFRAKMPGTCIITLATLDNRVTAQCVVTVESP